MPSIVPGSGDANVRNLDPAKEQIIEWGDRVSNSNMRTALMEECNTRCGGEVREGVSTQNSGEGCSPQ